MFKRFLSFLPRLWTNWLTLTGTIITTVAGCTVVLALAAQTVAPTTNVYASAVAFLVMPGVFVFGLVLIPIGFWWERFRRRKRGEQTEDPVQAAFRAALRDKVARRRIFFVGFLTLANLVLVGSAGYQALSFMDTPRFCGTVCHQVMQPEYTAYLRSPHARVHCVECHIGPGASWAVKAKITGLHQVWAVLVDSYPRPIPSPVHDLRPARDTCEHCHWPAKFQGNMVKFKTSFEDDKANSPQVTVALLKVGGAHPASGEYHGIHWHVSPDVEVMFDVLDESREKIGKIYVYKHGELVAEYLPDGKEGKVLQKRRMDCVDCHNRPTHIFDASPQAAVDRLMAAGQLDRGVAFLHQEAVKVLGTSDVPRDEAYEVFRQKLQERYQKDHPEVTLSDDQYQAAAQALAKAYHDDIFPDMKVEWGTYYSHLGHGGEDLNTKGCFRCHDDTHATAAGDTLSQDCDLCHDLLFEDEAPKSLPDTLRAMLSLAQPKEAAQSKEAAPSAAAGEGSDPASEQTAGPAADGGTP